MWSFSTINSDPKSKYQATPTGVAGVGVAGAGGGGAGLSTSTIAALVGVSILAVGGVGVGVAAASGAFGSSSSTTAYMAPTPPSPPPSPPPPCISDGVDDCVWVSRGGDGEFLNGYELLYNPYSYEFGGGDTRYELHNNTLCDEAGGNSNWIVRSNTEGSTRQLATTSAFVCRNKTDVTDCCNFDTDFYNTSGLRERRRQLEAYVYNASATLPAQILLPITPPLAKRLLDDRSVSHIGLPTYMQEPFLLMASSLYNYMENSATLNPATPIPATSSPCITTFRSTLTTVCSSKTTPATCGGAYVNIVDNKAGATCTWDTAATPPACVRGDWARYC